VRRGENCGDKLHSLHAYFITKYYLNDPIKYDKLDRACSTCARIKEKIYRIVAIKPEGNISCKSYAQVEEQC
jgi:hypothetical protein